MSDDPKWILKSVVLAIHDEQLAEHGGSRGLRDEGLLESALARPQQLHHYEDGGLDLIELAAAYGFAIAKNHPFVDGNKRTSAVVTELFLVMNGVDYDASDVDIVNTWVSLAGGEMDENELVNWLRERCEL